ncbi:MAG TPA: cell division protein FtsL [Desulfomonilia bacterium]|jgi:cell division protein FtsL
MKRVSRKTMLIAGIVFISSFCLWAMFHVWTRTFAMDLGYQISREQGIKEEFTNENKALRLEISTLKRTDRLESIAVKNLGMTPPSPEQMVYLWKKE